MSIRTARSVMAYQCVGVSPWMSACILVLLGVLATAASADYEGDGQTAETSFDADAQAQAEQVTGTVCASACHGWEVIFDGPRQVPAQWDFIVSDMVARGAAATDDQLALIRRYLKWSWGAVWVNSAGAEDLVAVLALPYEQAQAVIEHREAYGPFANLESLAAVPGVDASVLQAGADALIFN